MSKKKTKNKVCVIGLGYIGLPTAALFASKGFKVIGVDINKNVVECIKKGNIHIEEPDLHVLVSGVTKSGNLKAKLRPSKADVFIIAVPTPFKSGESVKIVPDLSYVESAIDSIIPYIEKDNLVILESTSPIGTTELVIAKKIEEKTGLKTGKNVFVAYSPERVLPGKIISEMVMNDRVIGGVDKLSAEKAIAFYKCIVNGNIYLTNARTAEFVKLAENAFRDVNIAFSNEISIIADKAGVNVWELIDLANKHPRVNILKPGPGVGGHCIAVDPWFIISQYEQDARLLKTARISNEAKTDYVINKIVECIRNNNIIRVVCFGLTYKENIDDLRESPSIKIVKELKEMKIAKIFACDPHIHQNNIDGVELLSLKAAINKAELAVFLVAHNEFIGLNKKRLKARKILDFKGII